MSGTKRPGSAKDPGSESTPGYVGSGQQHRVGEWGRQMGSQPRGAPRAGGRCAWGLAQRREVVLP